MKFKSNTQVQLDGANYKSKFEECSLPLIIFHFGDPCYGQLTAVKTRYPLLDQYYMSTSLAHAYIPLRSHVIFLSSLLTRSVIFFPYHNILWCSQTMENQQKMWSFTFRRRSKGFVNLVDDYRLIFINQLVWRSEKLTCANVNPKLNSKR